MRRRPEVALDDLLPKFRDDGHAFEPQAPWPDDAIEHASRNEMQALLRELIDQLPANYREALLLRDLEELPTDEVAALLDITPNAVKIRVHRARHALRTLLERRLRGSPHAATGEGS